MSDSDERKVEKADIELKDGDVKTENASEDRLESASGSEVDFDSFSKSEFGAGKMAETKLYNIHRLNGENYQLWKRQMEIYMSENKLKKYVDGSTPKPPLAADVPAWEQKDAEAQAFLMRGLDRKSVV